MDWDYLTGQINPASSPLKPVPRSRLWENIFGGWLPLDVDEDIGRQ